MNKKISIRIDEKKIGKSAKQNPSVKKSKPFPIVAIGASAGGLEAVTALLKSLPSNTGMAYIYVQHLDPTHKSMLALLLQKATKMKVVEAKNLMPIQRNYLFVMPPGKDMTIIDGVLRLRPRVARPTIHLPINEFFLSLAEKQRDGAIGIILSGNASDGALGLKAIKSAGGLTFAQDDSAKFQSMPKAAIEEGAVDLVLSPEEIAEELARLSNQSGVIRQVMRQSEEEIPAEEDLENILHLLRKFTGVDFIHYKKTTIRRRVIRRMLLHKLDTLKDYLKYLGKHTAEINLLYQDLLINVTTFFRDPKTTEFIAKTLLPRILKNKSAQDPVRIWVPGCSTGEEAYSIAMLLMEVLKQKVDRTTIQIFATDLSEVAIKKARSGIYSKADITNVSSRRLQNFFIKNDGNYLVIKSIREMCVFAAHNILKDPPFSRLDLISCSNLLIYLDSTLQQKLMATFHYALNNGGYLVLGASETIGESAELFSQPDRKYKVYLKKSDTVARLTFESSRRRFDNDKIDSRVLKRMVLLDEDSHTRDLEKVVDNIMLTRYIPASVIINNDFNILQFRGSTGLYLEPAPGKASLNLLKMARSGLSFELRNAVHKTKRSGEPFRISGIEIQTKGNVHKVSFEVFPFKADTDESFYLITFEEMMLPLLKERKGGAKKDQRVYQLEQELRNMQESMHSYMEAQEALNEELQSANEEVVSSNEELQSINEELETSKEEIESTNEELRAMNHELQTRTDQLAESYDYTQNIIDTVREAMMVLDKNLIVKSCNKTFYKLFKTREEETEGRLIFELGNHQWNIPALRILLEEIIPANHTFNDFRVEHTFEGLGEKVMILNARRMIQKVQGQPLILLAIEDITEHIEAQRVISQSEEWIRNIADTAPVMMWFADTARARTFFNKTWLEYTGKKMEDEIGTGWREDIHEDDKEGFFKIYNRAFDKQKPYTAEYRLRRFDGEYRWKLSSANPSYDATGKFTGFVGSTMDIHDKKVAEEILRESENKIRIIIDSLPQIAFSLRPDGSPNYSNDAWYEYTGEDRNHPFTSGQRRSIGHPDDTPALNEWLKKLKAGEPFEGEGRMRRSDGVYHWFLTRIAPVKDIEGHVTQWIGTSTDIHESRELMEQLRQSEERLQLSTEATHAGTFDFDMKTGALYWSDSMREINGFSTNEMIDSEKAASIIHPDDNELLMAAYKSAQDPKGTGDLQFEHRIIRNNDKKTRWIFIKAKVSFEGEKKDRHPIRVTGILLDVTERKETEEKIQQLLKLEKKARKEIEKASKKVQIILEGLPQMAWMTDAEGKVIFMNKMHVEFSGIGLKEIAEGKAAEIIHPDDYGHYVKIWEQHLKSLKPFEANVRYKRASDGEYRWHLVRAIPVKDAEGSITWVGTNTDVHDQKMFSEELEHAVKRRTIELNTANFNLERSNKELQQFAFAASHDLQEPLRKIQTFLDRITKQYKGELPDGSLDYFSRIVNAANRMRQLIEDLLNLSRASIEGKTFVESDLNEILQEAISNYDLRIAQKNAHFQIGKLPVIEAIPSQIKQLFENLLSNALKFTEQASPVITIESRKLSEDEVREKGHLDEENTWYEIIFADNGIGFEQKFAERIFVTFQRLHDTRKYPGTGIGLALCKKIVLNHSGEIYAESKENDGTAFHILLPEKQAEKHGEE